MNCADLRRLLAFDDAMLAPDPIALRAHLANCAACRREHFDLAALFCVNAPAAVSARRGSFVFAVVAAALLLAIGAALVSVAPSASTPELAAAAPRRFLPRSEISQVTREVSMLSGGRRRPLYSVSESTRSFNLRSGR